MTGSRPVSLVVLVATATDRTDDRRDLRNLAAERRAIREALEPAEQADLCVVDIRADAGLSEIFDAFQKHRGRVAVFHFGGHADSYRLQLEAEDGTPQEVGGVGLAEFLGKQTGLRVVFLNACSTYGHVEALHRAGVSTVIATSRRVRDDVAAGFAGRFYRALGKGASVSVAFGEAAAEARSIAGDDPGRVTRDMTAATQRDITREGWPWDAHVAAGAEAELEWSLSEAARDPLFGLPALPTRDVPDAPYLGLRRFEREHAEIFFGRGAEIRWLYEWVTGSGNPPILLLYGQSGVGKSSLLEAGLIPRLEDMYDVRVLRRSPTEGLLATLDAALRLSGLDEPRDPGDRAQAWKAVEAGGGKPLLVVLDQVEEAFTQPIEALPDELGDLVTVLRAIFADAAHRPIGKLVLGFRKEYHPEVEGLLKEAQIYRMDYFLEPLSRVGIIEAIEGPTRSKRLREHYRLVIEEPEGDNEPLPVAIADDLRQDRGSPIGPTLQVLLEKMWARVEAEDQRRLDWVLYGEVARPVEGGLLDAFLQDQLDALAEWKPALARSGLFLDILAHHTTPLGTSRSCTWEDLSRAYAHHQGILPELVEQSKRLRLITEDRTRRASRARDRSTRLAHDTLAPLVRKRFDESEASGQRARRILETRVRDWADGTGPLLDEADLSAVERGLAGMRTMTKDEQDLLSSSRRTLRALAGAQRHRDRTIGALIVTSMDSRGSQWDRTRAAQMVANAPISEGILRGPVDMWRAPMAFSPDGNRIVTVADDGIIAHVWSANGRGDPVLLTGHESSVVSAAFSPDGTHVVTGSSDQTARVWRADGSADPVVLEGHESSLNSAAFSPDGRHVVTASDDNTARIWPVDGTGEPIVLEGHDGPVQSAAFNSDGERVVTAADDKTARIWPADGTGEPVVLRHEASVKSATFSPDGLQVVTASDDNTARIWPADGTGEPVVLRHGGSVESATFSPDGLQVVTASRDNTARIWPADGIGEPVVLSGHENDVVSASFSPDGTRVATASTDGATRLWRADGVGKPIELAGDEYALTNAVFSPDGKRLVTREREGMIRVWRVDGTDEPVVLRGHEYSVESAAFSPDGKHVVTGCGGDGTARICRVDGTGDPVVLQPEGGILGVTFSSDGRRVFTASHGGAHALTVVSWVLDGARDATFELGPRHTGLVLSAVFSQDGARVVTVSLHEPARIWTIDGSGGPVVLGTSPVECAALSDDCLRVVTGAGDGTVLIWRADGTGEPVVLRGHAAPVRGASFSPDGERLVTASGDGTARLWRVDGTGQSFVLRGHASRYNGVNSAAFSPAGERIVTASDDRTARIWRADGRGEPIVLRGHEDAVVGAAFSPGGERVVTASRDRTARVWRVGLESLLEYLRSSTTACLTPAQRCEFLGETKEEARAKYEACERSYGRTPLPPELVG